MLCARLGVGTLLPPEAMQPPDALRVWRRLPRWEEVAARPAPSQNGVLPGEARARLSRLLGPGAEDRAGQADYADAATAAFAPRLVRGDPHLVLAEAGTGTGKTLGYVAPASLWAERNGGTVWISTYTRHLQRQIEAELARLHPDPAVRRRRVVLRKGRENYLCLLNMEEAVVTAQASAGRMERRRGAGGAGAAVAAGAVGGGRRRTGTCWGATCRDGSRSCSAAGRPRGWRTGAASASTGPARTTRAATSSTASGARARRTWWWRTMRW